MTEIVTSEIAATEPEKKPSNRPAKKAARKVAKVATVATKTRSGKKIRRARPGGKGEMAKKGSFALVAHIPKELHAKAWAKVRKLQKKDPSISLSSWLQSAIRRAAQ